ncbi:MAG TPA: winged helix-turn-helix domain-containing protein [Pyrinomonadaceae bacterium]|nr:winged helix-turn-helix domain-containing protein [Pyrinomonadaceae bacterium]
MSKQNKRIFEFGPFSIDTFNRQLRREGEVVPLRAKAVDTLLMLIESRGDVVEKDDLMKALWPDSFVEEANLTQNIYTLRKALGETGYIETIPRRGYRFMAAVTEKDDAPPEVIVIKERTTAHVSYEEDDDGQEDAAAIVSKDQQKLIDVTPRAASLQLTAPAKTPARKWVWIAIPIAVVLAIAALGWWWIGSKGPFENVKLTRFTTTGKALKAAISPDGKYVAYVLGESGQQSVALRQTATGKELQIVPPERTDIYGVTFSRDGNYVFYVSQAQNHVGVLFQVPSLGGSPDKLVEDVDSPVTLSPDGRQMAFIRFSPGLASIVIANINGAEERILTSTHTADGVRIGPNGVLPPTWSPDGSMIACPVSTNSTQWNQGIYGYAVKDGSAHLISDNWPALGRIEWAPDGKGLFATIIEGFTAPEQQIWFIPYPKGSPRRITNDLTDYRDVSVTADGRTLITIQSEKKANIWLASTTDLDHPTQLTATSYDGLNGLSWTPDGKLVYTSQIAGEQNLWIANAQKPEPKQLTAHAGFSEQPVVSPDGRYIVFLSNRNGQQHLWRIDIDGKNPMQLTHGVGDTQPTFTSDSQFVIFRSLNPQGLFRVEINGGEPVRLTERGFFDPNVSPDGKLVACGYRPAPADKNRIATLAIQGGPPSIICEWPAQYGRIRWMLDGSGITYAARQEGVGNIWIQPIDGGAAKQLTHWNPNPIFSFEWSRDGKWLAYASGSITSDVIQITDTRR